MTVPNAATGCGSMAGSPKTRSATMPTAAAKALVERVDLGNALVTPLEAWGERARHKLMHAAFEAPRGVIELPALTVGK